MVDFSVVATRRKTCLIFFAFFFYSFHQEWGGNDVMDFPDKPGGGAVLGSSLSCRHRLHEEILSAHSAVIINTTRSGMVTYNRKNYTQSFTFLWRWSIAIIVSYEFIFSLWAWNLLGFSPFGEGGAAGEPWETAEAGERGAGGTSQKPAGDRPKEPRVGGVPTQGALPHIRGTDSLFTWF